MRVVDTVGSVGSASLGTGLDRTGELAPGPMACTARAVHRFCAIADAMGVSRLDIIATEAVRRASNGKDLIEEIKKRSGRDIQILSGSEEAHYATLGVISGFYRPKGLVGDMAALSASRKLFASALGSLLLVN